MMAIQKPLLITASLLLMILVMTVGCEENFDPIQENDRYPFSISGYLDASADSQWVRVTAVRDSLFLRDSQASIDAKVTLEDLESGEKVTMKDSLHHYVDDKYAFNFGTNMDIKPEMTYRLTAERSDGMISSATVTLPPEFPDPIIRAHDLNNWRRTFLDTLEIHNVEHLTEVVLTYYLKSRGQEFTYIRHLNSFIEDAPEPSAKRVIFDIAPHLDYLEKAYCKVGYTALGREIRVSSAGPDWIAPATIDENILALPEGISNIKNGTGYVIGIINKTIPHNEGLESFGCPGVFKNQ